MTARENKRAAVKAIESDFVRNIRPVLSPMKAAIKKEIESGKSAHEAVDHVFREHDLRGHLKRLIVNAAVKAVKHG